MKKEDIDPEVIGMRVPSDEEKDSIIKYMNAYYNMRQKTCKKCSVIFLVIGVILAFAGSIAGIFALILGIISIFGSFAAIRSRKHFVEDNKVFLDGDFLVLDGYVKRIEADTENPGQSSVLYESENQKYSGMFTVRHEGLEVGLPLLLVYVSPDKIAGGVRRAFTPFMLSEAGLKHLV